MIIKPKFNVAPRRSDEQGWRWYGNKISVTTVLDQAVANPKLNQWFKKTSEKQIEKVRTETAKFGTDLHDYFEKVLTGQPLGRIDPKYQPHIDTFLAWRKQHRVKPLHCELSLCSEDLGIAGTCDFVGEIDGVMVVADWKTSTKYKVTYGWQLAGYRHMVAENLGLDTGMVGLQINRRTALPEMFTYQHYDWCDRRFKAALEVFKGLYFSKLDKIGWPWLRKDALGMSQQAHVKALIHRTTNEADPF